MDISAAGPQVQISGTSVAQLESTDYVATLELVLALAVEPTNFLGLEIQPKEFEAHYAREDPALPQAAQVLICLKQSRSLIWLKWPMLQTCRAQR
jgi:hypothetical protein